MKISPYRLSFFLTAAGSLLVVAGLLLPAAFGAAGAQAPAPLPTPASPAAQAMQPPAAPAAALYDDAAPTAVVVQRDPFVSDDAGVSVQGEQGDTAVMSQTQMISLPPGMRFVSVPNASAADRAPETPRDGLSGIVVGDHPYALFNVSGKTRVLAAGDMFQGRKIVRISLQGVTFDDRSNARIPLLDQ
jgi:hypothetical protein